MAAYGCMREFFRTAILKALYRDVQVIGENHVPTDGPVIFVANHGNQFVDAIMLVVNTNRVVRFLTAAKSMRRPIVGHLARGIKAIGVERPQDLAKKGHGTVSIDDGSSMLAGSGTAFLQELSSGDKIKLGGMELTVKSVLSDSTCEVTAASECAVDVAFTFMPKVDQADVFSEVHHALKSGDCIGIFPEGGSHDRTQMLDLKPGVAIMALGAMLAGSGPVKIVPCGLTYCEPYRFRSRAIVEYGLPIEVPQALAERYASDRRGAVAELMSQIEEAMKGLKPDVRNFSELQTLLTLRAIYKPRGLALSQEDDLMLLRQFIAARHLLRDDELGREIFRQAKEYKKMLKAAGLRDRDVRLNLASPLSIAARTCGAFVQMALLAPIALPALALGSPIAYINYVLSQKEKRKALAGSSVKVKALDVVASYKLIVSLVSVPSYNIVLAALATWLLRRTAGVKARFWQFPLMYAGTAPAWLICINACDRFFRAYARCSATAKSLKHAHTSLLQRRVELQQVLRTFAEHVGPRILENFESERIISKTALERDASTTSLSTVTSAHDLTSSVHSA